MTCPRCGSPNDKRSYVTVNDMEKIEIEVESELPVKQNDIEICFKCQHLIVFDNGKYREFTDLEFSKLSR